MLDLNAIRDCYMCYDAKEGKLTIHAMESLLRCICQLLGVDASALYEDDVVGMIEVAIQLANELDQELQTARKRIAELEEVLTHCWEQAKSARPDWGPYVEEWDYPGQVETGVQAAFRELRERIAELELLMPAYHTLCEDYQAARQRIAESEEDYQAARQRIAESEAECQRLRNAVIDEGQLREDDVSRAEWGLGQDLLAERQRAEEAEEALAIATDALLHAKPLIYAMTFRHPADCGFDERPQTRVYHMIEKALQHPAVQRLTERKEADCESD